MKSYNVLVSRKVVKDFEKIPAKIAEKIKQKINSVLTTDPYSCECLQGDRFKHLRKLKFSSYRCVFEIRESEAKVVVVLVGSRENFYEILKQRLD